LGAHHAKTNVVVPVVWIVPVAVGALKGIGVVVPGAAPQRAVRHDGSFPFAPQSKSFGSTTIGDVFLQRLGRCMNGV
jgi:hypothetical protein